MSQDNLTPEKEQRIAEKQVKSGMDQDAAKKEVAKEQVEEKSGQSFEKTRRLAIDVMEVQDGLEQQNAGNVLREMRDIDIKDVQDMGEKMAKTGLADELVQAGLGPQFVSTGAIGLENGTKNVIEKTQVYGDAGKMERMIQKVDEKHPELSREQVEKLSPDELKQQADKPEPVGEEAKARNEHTQNTHADSESVDSSDTTQVEGNSGHLKETLSQASALGGACETVHNLETVLQAGSDKGQKQINQNIQKQKNQQQGYE